MNGRSCVPRFACDPHRGLRAGHRNRCRAAPGASLLTAVLLMLVVGVSPAEAQGDNDFRVEVFGGLGGSFFDEKIFTFDAGTTAWLTDRWGLGIWGMWLLPAGSVREGGRPLFTPAVRYQHPLRRRRSLHVGAGLWHVGGYNDPPVLPYAEVLYGVPAANRQFGLRAGVRMLGYGPHLVLTFSFTSD